MARQEEKQEEEEEAELALCVSSVACVGGRKWRLDYFTFCREGFLKGVSRDLRSGMHEV